LEGVENMLKYAKAIVAGAIPVGALFLELADDGLVTDADWKLLVVAGLTAFGTWLVPNKPPVA
jgi:hypothetical protein